MILLTAEEMRMLDRVTIESGHATGALLMERAGAGIVEAMERRYGSTLGLRAVVLCGAGNNGGDGFVAARYLRDHGADVHVGVIGDVARIGPDANAHLQRLIAAGVRPVPIGSAPELEHLIATHETWDLALDAVLGTGARGEPQGLLAEAVQALRQLDEAGTRIVAADLPTGVGADTGEIARRAVRADLTVAFGAPKRGHFLYPGRAFVGALEVVDIGLALHAVRLSAFPIELATAPEMAELLPTRHPRAHKNEVGRVLIAGGSAGLTGAVALAALAALRSGAGYVQVAAPASLQDILALKLTEAITLPMPETPERSLSALALAPLRERLADVDVVALGPGLSRHPESAELARRLVAAGDCPLVLDADGLDAFAGHADALMRGAPPLILTPHLGEMHRLTGIATSDLEARRI
ncbi:MAG TPA: NAD(P)H-hydrate epimerase, partial [Candidatus Limnocylindria bacterium]|nr:NAD(P)H-hydrate epimerase [Candidatus Limnocylindria bacterium]